MTVKTSKVIARHGSWVVTTYGVECLTSYYIIEKKRLWQDYPDWSWEQQMSEKNWVNMIDFCAAITHARNYYAPRLKVDRVTGKALEGASDGYATKRG